MSTEKQQNGEQSFADDLVTTASAELPPRFFDRFMFNLHPADATAPSLILGAGAYPPRNVLDGFVVLSTGVEQRNLRFSTDLDDTDGSSIGPLSWQLLEDNERWGLKLGPNPTGLELDIEWHARTPYWLGRVEVENESDEPTSFEHLFQSGRYSGTMTLDGQDRDVSGWYGQRDRSRGVRTMSGGQGLHIWYQAQFADYCVGFLLVEDRAGGVLVLDGAIMHESGELDYVAEVKHDLTFTDGNDLVSGTVDVTTKTGRHYVIDADARVGGGFMNGGGYDGQHGRQRGKDFEEFDVYPFDGTVSPRTLGSALTDRCARFECDGEVGYGILEFALSRSSSYSYVPSRSSAE